MSILQKHSDRACVYFAVDYDIQLGPGFAEALSNLNAAVSPSQVIVKPASQYILRRPDRRFVITFTFQRFLWRALGLAEWNNNWREYYSWVESALKTMNVEKINRFGFKVSAFLPLGMSHEEMRQLMFGSFLGDADVLSQVCGDLPDPLLQLDGESHGWNYILMVSAITQAQSTQTFRAIPELGHFLTDQFRDTGINDFQERVCGSDCFYFDVDLAKKDVSASELRALFKSVCGVCEELASNCTNFLQSKPVEKVKNQ